MSVYSYAQTSSISVDNFRFQKAPLPSSFTRFAHKNFFSTEIIHTHMDFYSFRIYFLGGRWITWTYPSSRNNSPPRLPSISSKNAKHPVMILLERIITGCSIFHLSFQLIRLTSDLQSGLRSLTAACLHGNRRFPHRFPLPVHTGSCAGRRCSLRLPRSFP